MGCIVWCCCPCCAAAQEARQVERVSLTSNREIPRIGQATTGLTLPAVTGTVVQTQQRGADNQLRGANSFSSYTEGSDSPRSGMGLLKGQERVFLPESLSFFLYLALHSVTLRGF